MSQNFNKQPAQGPHSALSGLGVLQSEGAAPAPAGAPATAWVAIQSHTGAADQRIYVMCHQCEVCQHIGINDERPTESACNRSSCGWHGPSPSEDLCPGCGETGTMSTACPECGGHYVLLAEANIVPTRLSGVAAPAGASELPPLPKPRAWMMEWPQHAPSFTCDKSDYVSWHLGKASYPDGLKDLFTAAQMHDYARAALSGAPAVAAEPLTDEKIILATEHIDMDVPGCFIRIARAIEQAHGIGSPGAKEDGQHG